MNYDNAKHMLSNDRPQWAVTCTLAVSLTVVCLLFANPVFSASNSAIESFDPRDLGGVWIVTTFMPSSRPVDARITRTIDGEPVPLRPEPQRIYDERIAVARTGTRAFADTEAYCLPSGMPRAMRGPNYPMQILQTPGQITMLFEALNTFRIIRMNEEQVPAETAEPSWMGNSVGKWEGDTLVIDTVGLNDLTTLDKLGLPHSDQLHLVEEIRRTSADNFEVTITIDDPVTFTETWQLLAKYRRAPEGTRLYEFVCSENNQLEIDEDGTYGI